MFYYIDKYLLKGQRRKAVTWYDDSTHKMGAWHLALFALLQDMKKMTEIFYLLLNNIFCVLKFQVVIWWCDNTAKIKNWPPAKFCSYKDVMKQAKTFLL